MSMSESSHAFAGVNLVEGSDFRRLSGGIAILAVISSLGALTIPQAASAGPSNFGDLTLETMMEAQSQDQLLLQAALPWKLTDIVNYTYAFDTSTGAFSFSTNPGQSIAGLPFSFSTTATLDAPNGTWSWSGSGLEGGTSFQITGDGSVQMMTGRAAGQATNEDIKGKYVDDDGTEYDAAANVEITDTKNGKTSFGTGSVRKSDGTLLKKGTVRDTNTNNAWNIYFITETPPSPPDIKSQLDSGSIFQNGPTEFQGFFAQTVIPEPSAWTLILLGFGTVGAGLRRCRLAGA